MATFYVDKNNAVPGNTGGESDPLRSPQEAQKLAGANDTIIVKQGTGPYPGPLLSFASGQTYNFNGNKQSGCIDLNALVKSNDDYVWKESSDSSKGWYLAINGRSKDLIPNGNFDSLSEWLVLNSLVQELNYEYVKTGFSSYKLTAGSNNGYLYDTVPSLLSSSTYKVIGSVYADAGTIIHAELFKVGGGYPEVIIFSETASTSGWHDFNVDVPTLPVDGDYFFRFRLFSASDVIYVDQIHMYRTDITGDQEPDCWGLATDIELGVIDGVWWSSSHNLSGVTQAPIGVNNWDYGDHDSLGFNTFYAFIDGGVNPATTDAIILANNVNYLMVIGSTDTGCKIYNAVLDGSQNTIVRTSSSFEISLSKLLYVDDNGIDIAATTGEIDVYYCEFYDTGHRALNCSGDGFTLNAYGNAFIGPHLMLRNEGNANIVCNFYNNVSDRLVAGAIQWDGLAPAENLNEDYNQFRIDPDSHHRLKLGHTVDTSTWTITGVNSLPASTDTQITAQADGTGCGTDPEMIGSDRGQTSATLSKLGPCVNSGRFVEGVNDNGSAAADGGYVYRLPNMGPWQKPGSKSGRSSAFLNLGINL